MGGVERTKPPAAKDDQLADKLADELADELYLTYFSRFPTAEERKTAVDYLRSAASRRRGAEDLAWSMLNSLEFVFGH
jgi:hypothetical protein